LSETRDSTTVCASGISSIRSPVSPSDCREVKTEPLLLSARELPASASSTAFTAASVIARTCCSVRVVEGLRDGSMTCIVEELFEEGSDLGFDGLVSVVDECG
jgi:hypothetical protein